MIEYSALKTQAEIKKIELCMQNCSNWSISHSLQYIYIYISMEKYVNICEEIKKMPCPAAARPPGGNPSLGKGGHIHGPNETGN